LDRYVALDPRLKHWYVCFSDSNQNIPMQTWLKPGFRHVRAFAFDAASGAWVTFDPGWDGITIRAITDPVKVKRMITHAYVKGPVLYCKTVGEPVFRPRFLMFCTSQICHLLGVNLLVHTPWRLFCALKERGASEILFED
jgi:hypothetical protein